LIHYQLNLVHEYGDKHFQAIPGATDHFFGLPKSINQDLSILGGHSAIGKSKNQQYSLALSSITAGQMLDIDEQK